MSASRCLGIVALIMGVSMATTLVADSGALPVAPPLAIVRAVSYQSDDILEIVAHVTTAFPDAPCTGTATSVGRSAALPHLVTGSHDGAEWYWYDASGMPRASLHIAVSCALPDGIQGNAATDLIVGPGPPTAHPKHRLMRLGSLHVAPWVPGKAPGGGVGFSGTAPLYPVGQCTWYVAMRRPDLPYFPGSSGNAKNWIRSARADRIPTGLRPHVTDVAVFEPGQYATGIYGHVAYVVAVRGRMITIAEANYYGRPPGSERTIPWQGLRFIYKVREPTPPAPSRGVKPLTETTGGTTNTWSNYRIAGGSQGPTLGTDVPVKVECRVFGRPTQDGDPWWYRIGIKAGRGRFYASADAFYNNGQTSGSLVGTPLVDPSVGLCAR
jgi:hypothetical protein